MKLRVKGARAPCQVRASLYIFCLNDVYMPSLMISLYIVALQFIKYFKGV
jgi:hypothetical protein